MTITARPTIDDIRRVLGCEGCPRAEVCWEPDCTLAAIYRGEVYGVQPCEARSDERQGRLWA